MLSSSSFLLLFLSLESSSIVAIGSLFSNVPCARKKVLMDPLRVFLHGPFEEFVPDYAFDVGPGTLAVGIHF